MSTTSSIYNADKKVDCETIMLWTYDEQTDIRTSTSVYNAEEKVDCEMIVLQTYGCADRYKDVDKHL